MNGTTRLKIGDINKNLICVLCGGYLIDATTIIECLHSFCRTCIVTFLKTSRTCPVCDTVVHKTRPHQNIRSDKLLQDLVYKLVPGLYKDEMRRRREFYTLHYEAAPKRAGEERGDEMSDRFTFTEEETISLALYLCPDGGNERFGLHRVFTPKEDLKTRMDRRIKESVDVRYLQCKAAVTVALLKKFLKLKYSLPDHFLVDIFYNDETLRDCYTLCDVAYTFNWRRRAPLIMTFCVYQGEKLNPRLVERESCRQFLALPESKIKVEKNDNVGNKCKPETVLATSTTNLSSSSGATSTVSLSFSSGATSTTSLSSFSGATSTTSLSSSRATSTTSLSSSSRATSTTSLSSSGPTSTTSLSSSSGALKPSTQVTNSVEKKPNKPSKSKVTLSDPPTSTSLSKQLDVQPSSSGVSSKQTQPDLPALSSDSKCKTVTSGTTKSKKADKRKSSNDKDPPEGSSSKKRRKVTQEFAKVASQSGQLNRVSSSQTVSRTSKCVSEAPVLLSVVPSKTVSSPVTSEPNLLLSQPVVSPIVHIPTTLTPAVATCKVTLAVATCTVTPSLYSQPVLTSSVITTNSNSSNNNSHNTYDSSIVTHLHTMATSSVVSLSKTTLSSSTPTPATTHAPSSSTTVTPSQTSTTVTHSVLKPFITSGLLASPLPSSSTLTPLPTSATLTSLSNTPPPHLTKVSQKARKTTVDPDSHNKNTPSLKRPASSPVPIAPAPAKLQNLAPPPAVDITKLIKLNSDVYPPGGVTQPVVCPTATAPVKSLVCPTVSPIPVKSKSSRVATNNKTLTPTTTLKFSVSSLLSATPGKSSLVSVTHGNKPVTNSGLFSYVNSTKGHIDQSVMMGNLSIHPGTKCKVTSKVQSVNKPQHFSNQSLPCQSIPPVHSHPPGSFHSTSSVSATSIASPTPASSASPTPAAVPVQQSQTQGSDSGLITSIKQEPDQKATQGTSSCAHVNKDSKTSLTKTPNTGGDNTMPCTDLDKTVEAIKVSNVTLVTSESHIHTVSSQNAEHTALTPKTSLPSEGRLSSSSSIISSSSPELCTANKMPALSPTNNISCPLRKQTSSQKKKIADIANTLLQNHNSKVPQVTTTARKNLQKSAANMHNKATANMHNKATANIQNKSTVNMKHLNCTQLNHEFYLGVVSGQTLQNLNICQGSLVGNLTNVSSDEPLNLVKRKEVNSLPNSMFILDVPNTIQGHK